MAAVVCCLAAVTTVGQALAFSGVTAALAQVSVFEGGFTLEAAEAVLNLCGAADAPWVVDVVNALVDKSLVIAEEQRGAIT